MLSSPCTLLSFTSLLSFSHYYSPLCHVLFFVLLGIPLCDVIILFGCFFILSTRFITLLLSFSRCYVILFMLLLLVCCYSLKNLYYPLTFLLVGSGSGRESRVEKLYFFNKYFSFCLFPTCLLFFCFFCFNFFGFWFVV